MSGFVNDVEKVSNILQGKIYRWRCPPHKRKWTEWVTKEDLRKECESHKYVLEVNVFIRDKGWVGVNTAASIEGGFWTWWKNKNDI